MIKKRMSERMLRKIRAAAREAEARVNAKVAARCKELENDKVFREKVDSELASCKTHEDFEAYRTSAHFRSVEECKSSSLIRGKTK